MHDIKGDLFSVVTCDDLLLFIATHIDVQWRASQTSHHTSSTLGSSPLYSGNKYNLKYSKPLAEESYDIRYYSYYNVGDIYIYIYIYISFISQNLKTHCYAYIYTCRSSCNILRITQR